VAVGRVEAGFNTATSIAVSGLRAASLRLDVAAHNIANLNTDGFTPSRVLDAAIPNGGVQSSVDTRPRHGGGEPRDASTQQDDQQSGSGPSVPGDIPGRTPAMGAPSETNPVGEIVSVLLAQAAFAASLRVLKTDAAVHMHLLESLG
jgi:hypothetical protein